MTFSCDLGSRFVVLMLLAPSTTVCSAADICVIGPLQEPVIAGKEVDWIYGDYLMKNDQLSVIIAAPLSTRDANMTIRNIGASILDFTLNHPSNDQLSAYTPTAGRYLFHDPSNGGDQLETTTQCLAMPFVQDACQRRHDRNGAVSAGRRKMLSSNQPFRSKVMRRKSPSRLTVFVPTDGFRLKHPIVLRTAQMRFFDKRLDSRSAFKDHRRAGRQGRPDQLRYNDVHVERTDGC